MKISGFFLLPLCLFFISLFSCQKELFFENSTGSLLDSSGVCRPSVVNGEYRANAALTLANYVDVQVDVVTPGSYYIVSDTINGFSFNGGGRFETSGGHTARLLAAGTPLQPGTYIFTVQYSGTSCSFSITVLPSIVPPAQVVLGGAPGGCTGVIVGSYVAGQALNATNIVVQDVTINATGPYVITTDTLNGIYFAASGNFPATGPSTIDLVGNGTPLSSGPFTYTLTAGNSTCNFTITFASAASNDYFPLTQNSFWTYDSDITAPDSMYKVSSSTASIAGNSYTLFNIGSGTVGLNNFANAAYRKSGAEYFHYFTVDSLTTLNLDAPVAADIKFLDESAPAGTTWQSADYNGTEAGVPVRIKYTFTIDSRGITYVVNGVTYPNVIKVVWHGVVDRNGAGYANDTDIESYYARGVGLIEFKITTAGNTTWLNTESLRHYRVF